ncbi:acyltransferase family protein [Meridianimaribacter flavus]
MRSKRIYGLDVIRSIAISLVVISHCTFLFYTETNNPIILFTRTLGAVGVDLFFVLSGYLIGGLLLKNIESGKTSFSDLITFWKRRWLRTLPNYFLVLVLNVVLLLILGDVLPKTLWLYIPFLQNFINPHPNFFTEAWSLSIEEYAYLLLPFLLYLSFFMLQKQHKKLFLRVTLIMIVALFAFKISYYFNTNVTSYKDWSSGFRKVVLYRMDAIYFGFLLVYIMNTYATFFKQNRKICIGIACAVFGGTHLLIYHYSLLPQTHLGFYVFFYLPLVLLSCALLFPYCIQLKENKIFGKIFYFLSTRSYAIYLVNYSLILLSIQRNFKIEQLVFFEKGLLLLLFLVLTLSMSQMIYAFFERPILFYRDKHVGN